MRNELVKLIRSFRGMTQKQFSEWLEVSESSIALVEAGHRDVSPRLENKIALKFDVTDRDFIDYCERVEQTRKYFLSRS